MTRERGVLGGEDPINFRAHEIRAGNSAGAREDFEAMIRDLVAVDHPDVRRVRVTRGDGGIDAFVGDLNGGGITIWQVKYFIDGIGGSQRAQIKDSFESAKRHADERANTIEKWILCVPTALDEKGHIWWNKWREETMHRTRFDIQLWDGDNLVELLSRPEARDVRREYYGRRTASAEYPPPPGYSDSVVPTAVPARRSSPNNWEPGSEHTFGELTYLLYRDVSERHVGTGTIVREAIAGRVEGDHPLVHLKQVEATGPGDSSDYLNGLREQARVLEKFNGSAGLPRKSWLTITDNSVTLAVTQPSRPRVWRRAYGPRDGDPVDPMTAGWICREAANVAETLAVIHRAGHQHRTLTPDSIFGGMPGASQTFRDGGQIAMPPTPGEGEDSYQAPEQRRMIGHTLIGPATDEYQLGCLLYHTITGYRPSGETSPPIQASQSGLPAELDHLIGQCLRADPADRRADLTVIGRQLKHISQRIVGGFR